MIVISLIVNHATRNKTVHKEEVKWGIISI